ncbi:MAG: hypothetical protein WAO21_07890 [Verrucomicrobiia bacterium]
MNKIRKYASGMLATLALAFISVPGQAQTTNFVVYNFDTNEVSGIWGNFFGGYFQSVAWDPTTDAGSGTGSMMVNLDCIGSDQYVLWDGPSGPGAFPYSADLTSTFTNISFDILYSTNSAVRTNTVGAGTNGSTGIGSLDYGSMRIGSSKGWDQDWVYNFAIPATNGFGQPNTNWTHVSVDLRGVVSQIPELSTWTDILFGLDGNNFNNQGLLGTQTYWIDNIQFIGPIGGIQPPPPVMSVQKAVPALRLFGGSGGPYSRSQLTTIDENQSWVDVPQFPVKYSFTILSAPTVPGSMDMHIFFCPLNFFNGETINGNHDMDYHILNMLWFQVLTGVGTNTCTADIMWKTNSGYQNPTHTDLLITNPVAVGTWTLTFSNNSSGSVTAPGASPVPFTISDPNVETDFGGQMILSFGNQCWGNAANEGVPNDWTKVSVTGVTGFNESDDFTTEPYIDPLVWDVSNSNTPFSVELVTNGCPYWVTWTSPSENYNLGVSTNLTSGPWKLPEYYNGYGDGTNIPNVALQGTVNWALIPSSCLPTVDGQPQTGQKLAPTAFFRVSNPSPAQ